MASIKRKEGMKNWIACFTDHSGKRVQRTTGLPGKKEAQKKADEMEIQAGTAPPPKIITARLWREEWLAAHKGAVSDASYLAYSHRSGHFLTHIGQKAEAPIKSVLKSDIISYRTAMLKVVSPMTANAGIKTIRMMFTAARREGLISENPAEGIKALKDAGKVDRRPFTMEELSKLLAVAEGEWKTMILFGVYTGQRLNDMALFQWSNIDDVAGEIRFKARKTGKFMAIPLAAPLLRHMAALERDNTPGAYVLPSCARAVLAGKSRNGTALSGQFRALMVKAGLAQLQVHRALKQGRAVRRDMRELVFHSLRHTATSLMKNAGVSSAVVMDIIGHDSPAVSAIYTHIDSASKRKALDAMPDLL